MSLKHLALPAGWNQLLSGHKLLVEGVGVTAGDGELDRDSELVGDVEPVSLKLRHCDWEGVGKGVLGGVGAGVLEGVKAARISKSWP
jgi:hypothetical protein